MSWFGAFRDKPFPTAYGENKTAVSEDILFIGLVYASIIIAFSLLIVIPGYPGREKITQIMRIVVSLFILIMIMLCNFGQDWEVSSISDAHLPYKSGYRGEVKADVSVKIGLRSVNITLKGTPEYQTLPPNDPRGAHERINYNERFRWDDEGWVQGRIGFGTQASYVNREFRDAQIKGTPFPILWIAEYFTLDGEGIRWGRFYRQSGYYTHILLWTAFPLWLVSCALFYMVISYGGLCMILTGAFLVVGNITYSQIRNINQLKIPMADDKVLTFHWGWCFWLNLVNGIFCLIGGALVIIVHNYKDEWTYKFFGSDRNNEIEEIYSTEDTFAGYSNKSPPRNTESTSKDQSIDEDAEKIYEDPSQRDAKLVLRKKSLALGIFSKKMKTPPSPSVAVVYEEENEPVNFQKQKLNKMGKTNEAFQSEKNGIKMKPIQNNAESADEAEEEEEENNYENYEIKSQSPSPSKAKDAKVKFQPPQPKPKSREKRSDPVATDEVNLETHDAQM